MATPLKVSFVVIFVILISLMVDNCRSIVVPEPVTQVAVQTLTHVEPLGESTLRIEGKLAALAKVTPCLKSFVNSFMNLTPSRIVIVQIDVHSRIARTIAAEIQEERPIYLFSGDIGDRRYQRTASDALIIVANYKYLQRSTIKLLDVCGKNCRFAVMLTVPFPDDETLLKEARFLVYVLWRKKIAHVAILAVVRNHLRMLKSQGFDRKKLRTPSSPIFVGSCSTDERYISRREIFSPMHMNESIINLSYFDKIPYVSTITDEAGTHAYGMEAWIMIIASKKLKFHVLPFEISWRNDSTIEEEVWLEIESDKDIDIVIGGILWDPDDEIDFTVPYDLVQVVWIIPKYSNLSLRGLVTPLADLVWYAVGGVLLLGIVLRIILFRDTTFLEIWALILGVGWYKQPTKTSARLYYISWVIFGYLLTQFYLASLAGQLMAQADVQMETMLDLLDSNLALGGTKTHMAMFAQAEDSDDNPNTTDVIDEISKKFIAFEEDHYNRLLHDLINGENVTVALAVTLNVSSMGSLYSHKYVHTMSEVLASYPLAFAVWRGLPYLSQIDDVLGRLIQGGIVSYLGRKAARDSGPIHHMDDDSTNLKLEDIAPGFLLLVMGYMLSLLCLFMELVVFKYVKRSKPKPSIRQSRLQRRGVRNAGRRQQRKRIKPHVKFRNHILVY